MLDIRIVQVLVEVPATSDPSRHRSTNASLWMTVRVPTLRSGGGFAGRLQAFFAQKSPMLIR
jgi:hypothetical protein